MDLLTRPIIEEIGIMTTHDRRHRFFMKRFKNALGLSVYLLENKGMGERIFIPRHHFDRMRADLTHHLKSQNAFSDLKIKFHGKEIFILKAPKNQGEFYSLMEVNPGHKSTGQMRFRREAVFSLMQLFYSDDLDHPCDTLDLITLYHRIFQFSFVEGSASITSDLMLRKDVLCQVDTYRPKASGIEVPEHIKAALNQHKPDAKPGKNKIKFKEKLGERDSKNRLRVNYEALFDPKKADHSMKTPKAAESDAKASKSGATKTSFPLPLLAAEVKAFDRPFYSCQFSKDDINEFRELFLGERSSEFFLGFEIYDAIFRKASGLKTFRFPLYYMRVTIEESGRELFIHPDPKGTIFLNHLALANLMESFAPHVNGTVGPVGVFFENLLAQSIKVSGRSDRVRLMRALPLDEEVFEKTRELLLGFQGEDGQGGLLSHLKLVGIEADLDAVMLYKASKNEAPLMATLNSDLARIQKIAHDAPSRFYTSLLGKFLTPDSLKSQKNKTFSDTIAMPGAQPKSIRNLIDKLNHHDLVLLEGPPGTGKTFTNMNLFFHAMITKKRLLVVSDQKAAISALTEKITEYLVGKDHLSASTQHLLSLWQAAIKVVDETPNSEDSLATWCRVLKDSLALLDPKTADFPKENPHILSDLKKIDDRMSHFHELINAHMAERLGPNAPFLKRVAPKRLHATTVHDIENLTTFLRFIAGDEAAKHLFELSRYIKDREYLDARKLKPVFRFLDFTDDLKGHWDKLTECQKELDKILKRRPKSLKFLYQLVGDKLFKHPVLAHFHELMIQTFPPGSPWYKKTWQWIKSLFKNPIQKDARTLFKIIERQKRLLAFVYQKDPRVIAQLRTIHRSLYAVKDTPVPLCLEICRFAIESQLSHQRARILHKKPSKSVQECLVAIKSLQDKRDELIRKAFIARLGSIAERAYTNRESTGTSMVTTIQALLENLKTYPTIEAGSETLLELQRALVDAFPVWICRKQTVPFLFPCQENLFDLIIVDEATQCKVDDALPLLFRAGKLMVVGDEKQTVLAKESSIDDYLFAEFELSEHLRTSQAMGMKGGGSHIFGLVKGIKQAGVMLDEHYRCPPAIIQYSNHYVYHDELKTMQWEKPHDTPAVVVDFREEKEKDSGRQDSGKYKGLETKMIDRFLQFVADTIRAIEKETGKTIHTNTDVALCYFLLKNEPYFKAAKGPFLAKLNRGDDILDGAGAALQGKEREYIFYLWDINKGNFPAFRQGDDPDKRKGELNVLMSRPKVRAYHYLHRHFASLDHRSSSITDYLWSTYLASKQKEDKKSFVPRTKDPGPEFIPWRRSSGELMRAMLLETLRQSRLELDLREHFFEKTSVVVGDPYHKVDFVLVSKDQNPKNTAIGLIDLAGFDGHRHTAQDIVDYYFQCLRAAPKISPYFLFMHELASPHSRAFKLLKRVFKNELQKDELAS